MCKECGVHGYAYSYAGSRCATNYLAINIHNLVQKKTKTNEKTKKRTSNISNTSNFRTCQTLTFSKFLVGRGWVAGGSWVGRHGRCARGGERDALRESSVGAAGTCERAGAEWHAGEEIAIHVSG